MCWLNNGEKTSGEKLPYLDARTLRGKTEKTIVDNGIIVSEGEKVILVDGENSGEVFIVPYRGYMGSTFKILQMVPLINVEFIKIILDYYKDILKESKTGAAIPHLNKQLLKSIIIGVPPIEEQYRIVNQVQAIMQYIDLLESNQNDYTDLVESLKKAILQSAIQGTLVEQDDNDEPASELLARIRAEKMTQLGKKYVESYIYKGDDNRYYEKIGTQEPILLENLPFEIPSSWSWARLGTIIDFSKSLTVKVDTIKDTDWVLDLEDIEKDTGKVLVKKTMLETKSKSDKHKFFAGNVLYSKLRPYLNKVLIADEDGYCTTEILAFDFGKYIVNHYARYFLMSSYFLDYATNGALGDMPRIRSSLGNNGLMPIPPYNEQIRICTRIKHILDSIKDEA